jgi:hypothetical protein
MNGNLVRFERLQSIARLCYDGPEAIPRNFHFISLRRTISKGALLYEKIYIWGNVEV